MTLQEAVDLIKGRLGSRADTDIDALITSELGATQLELEENPDPFWFQLTEDTSTTTTADEHRVPVPCDFIMEAEDQALWYVDSDGVSTPLDKYEYDKLKQHFEGASGPPEAYSLNGSYFNIFPLPDAAYSLKIRYYSKDAAISTLATTETNNWLTVAPSLIANLAGFSTAMWVKDQEAAAFFQRKAEQAEMRLRTMHVARAEVNVEREVD